MPVMDTIAMSGEDAVLSRPAPKNARALKLELKSRKLHQILGHTLRRINEICGSGKLLSF